MSSQLALFHDLPAGAIETLVDEQNQPLFKGANQGKYLDIVDQCCFTRADTKMGSDRVSSLKKLKNPPDAFTKRDSAIEIVLRSNKPKAHALVKWLS